ncbi:DUF3471 domain-containing protein [Telluribacter sp. SYSU D00476]|uniref:DUF3471 domain-containing protein n=1 Tax=Telluribacter sp. SYSU D00476 TaxID=2811430 RepID=UPI001FF35E1F|nr:DUF3471 domain-containing protein [Telluribacter sp. SYSU D00476]
MKKNVLIFACVISLSASYAAPVAEVASSMATPVCVADQADLSQYAGKYKFEGLPFEYITISVVDGKLMISTGTDEGELTPVKDAADKFDAGGQATLTFTRDADQKVTGLTLDAQGFTFDGKKEA